MFRTTLRGFSATLLSLAISASAVYATETISDDLVVTGDAEFEQDLDCSGSVNADYVNVDGRLTVGSMFYTSNGYISHGGAYPYINMSTANLFQVTLPSAEIRLTSDSGYLNLYTDAYSFYFQDRVRFAEPIYGPLVVGDPDQPFTNTYNNGGYTITNALAYDSSSNTGGIDSDLEVNGRLYVNRNGLYGSALIRNSFESCYHEALDIQAGIDNPSSSAPTLFSFYFDGDGDPVGYVMGYHSAIGIWSSSDERVKKDIEPVGFNGKNIVKNIEVIEYRMKDDTDDEEKTIGFSAQNLQKYYPSAVNALKASEVGYDKTMGQEELLTICPTKLIPVLVKQAQTQQEDIDALVAENKAMMEMMMSMTDTVSALKQENTTLKAQNVAMMEQQGKMLRAINASGIACQTVATSQSHEGGEETSMTAKSEPVQVAMTR